jgi:hypothetical protein
MKQRVKLVARPRMAVLFLVLSYRSGTAVPCPTRMSFMGRQTCRVLRCRSSPMDVTDVG